PDGRSLRPRPSLDDNLAWAWSNVRDWPHRSDDRAGHRAGEICRAALRQYWQIAARLLRRRRIARILGPVGIYVSRRGPCADVTASHGALRNNHEAARGSVSGL